MAFLLNSLKGVGKEISHRSRSDPPQADQRDASPYGEGLGTFIWEPTKWGKTLFDKDGFSEPVNRKDSHTRLTAGAKIHTDAVNRPVLKRGYESLP